MKTAVPLLTLTAGQQDLDALAAAAADVRSAGRVAAIDLRDGDPAQPRHEVAI
jgi:hypothetical protein